MTSFFPCVNTWICKCYIILTLMCPKSSTGNSLGNCKWDPEILLETNIVGASVDPCCLLTGLIILKMHFAFLNRWLLLRHTNNSQFYLTGKLEATFFNLLKGKSTETLPQTSHCTHTEKIFHLCLIKKIWILPLVKWLTKAE